MAIILPATPITTAATVVGSVFQLRGAPVQRNLPGSISLQANFAWGSGGTTANVYIQTSLDGGTTWCDALTFGFTTAIARFVGTVNSGKSVIPATFTDGSLAINTVNDGLFGPLWRAKLVSTGTYAGGTTITVTGWSNGLEPMP